MKTRFEEHPRTPDGSPAPVHDSLSATPASRRSFFRRISLVAALFTVPGAFAEELARKTAWVTEGPFYPPKLPLDTDNDLIIVNDSTTPAVGEITHLSGRLLDTSGEPIRNATIEIWEADCRGVYLADGRNRARFDSNFQGFGRFLTGTTGEYYFRTIKPTRYAGRPAPHIHFKIKVKGREPWTTQLFVSGFPSNNQDGIWRALDSEARASVTKDFVPLKESRIGELAVQFNIVLGETPHA
jgi:protocatechuate 3,4-dioxygenase beta subunit